MWQNWTNAILGLVIIAVAVYGYATMGTTLGMSFGVLGALIAVAGFWGATEAPSSKRIRTV
jgi:hypothetical protein